MRLSPKLKFIQLKVSFVNFTSRPNDRCSKLQLFPKYSNINTLVYTVKLFFIIPLTSNNPQIFYFKINFKMSYYFLPSEKVVPNFYCEYYSTKLLIHKLYPKILIEIFDFQHHFSHIHLKNYILPNSWIFLPNLTPKFSSNKLIPRLSRRNGGL